MDGDCITEGDVDALEDALWVCMSTGVPDDATRSDVDPLALGVSVCERLGERITLDDCVDVDELLALLIPLWVGVLVTDGLSAADGDCVTDADVVCVIDGVLAPDWLAVSVGLIVPVGVAPAEAEPVDVTEEEDGEAMTTRRRRLL